MEVYRKTEQKVQGELRTQGDKPEQKSQAEWPPASDVRVISLIGNIRTGKSLEKESRLVGVRGCGIKKQGVRSLVSAEFGFGMMGRFWR